MGIMTVKFANSTKAGHMLVTRVYYKTEEEAAGDIFVTDSQGNTWTAAPEIWFDIQSNRFCRYFYTLNIPGGPCTVTANGGIEVKVDEADVLLTDMGTELEWVRE